MHSLLPFLEKLVLSFAVVLVLDVVFKVRVQIGWSIAYRKSLTITYSILPWKKFALMIATSVAGAFVVTCNSSLLAVAVVILVFFLLLFGIYASSLYRAEVRNRQR